MILSVEFQEWYKRLDRLCKDYLSSTEGVSEYIRQMESTTWRDRNYVATFDSDYKQLKHIRWVRNQLAHEVGTLDSEICTEDDLAWVKDFYNRIFGGADPFTVIRKAKEAEQHRSRLQAERTNQQAQPERHTSSMPQNSARSKPSLWCRIVSCIKDLFS